MIVGLRKILLLSIITFFSLSALAKEVIYPLRSPKGLLMGDAYTTLADGDYTLFYNPATLGRHKGFSIYPLPFNFTLWDPIDDMDRFDDLPNDTQGVYNELAGIPLHFQSSIAPSLKLGRFGLQLYAASTSNLQFTNSVHPMVDFYHTEDNGFIMGYAWKFGDVSMGLSYKYIKRRGVHSQKSIYDARLMDAINNGIEDIGDFKDVFGINEGKGQGLDLGFEYFKKNGASEFALGLSFLDIGDTKFKVGDVVADVPTQKMKVNLGISWKQDWKLFDYTFSVDLHPLNERIDNKRRLHLGAEFGTPVIRGLLGWNAGYFCYGAEFNLGFIDIYTGFYDVEIGSGYKSKKANRFLLYLSLLDFSFDA